MVISCDDSDGGASRQQQRRFCFAETITAPKHRSNRGNRCLNDIERGLDRKRSARMVVGYVQLWILDAATMAGASIRTWRLDQFHDARAWRKTTVDCLGRPVFRSVP